MKLVEAFKLGWIKIDELDWCINIIEYNLIAHLFSARTSPQKKHHHSNATTPFFQPPGTVLRGGL